MLHIYSQVGGILQTGRNHKLGAPQFPNNAIVLKVLPGLGRQYPRANDAPLWYHEWEILPTVPCGGGEGAGGVVNARTLTIERFVLQKKFKRCRNRSSFAFPRGDMRCYGNFGKNTGPGAA